MKKKLLVLSASAILASNFVFDNNASAVVRGTKHESEALKMTNNKKNNFSANQDVNYGSNNYSPKQDVNYGSTIYDLKKIFITEVIMLIKNDMRINLEI
ncbi:hypothetical protein [Staphylococcus agnetis]|uniref:hypothetical protein n=1 Tax=Staphylococcus agnetis TaxID=985762 RepID=UPI000D03CE37|nr:hypothetical protein [Staphylococcus agnetis]